MERIERYRYFGSILTKEWSNVKEVRNKIAKVNEVVKKIRKIIGKEKCCVE